jgi:hypothetical protein
MGQVIGHLRTDRATHGEKLVLRKLSTALPQDFSIYVECPLEHGRVQRFPDFIVLSNFGVVVLEVKDWVEVVEADKYGARIRRRDGVENRHRNPVRTARDCAEILADELQAIPELINERHRLDVPWGYAAVLPNLPASIITQLRRAWGERYVLGAGDLEPHVVTKRLKATVPRHRDLRNHELRCIRGVVNPTVLIVPENADKPAIILDDQQERIVTEAPRAPVAEKAAEPVPAVQDMLLRTQEPAAEEEVEEELPALDQSIVFNASIRLVRGVAGSGKTLVLTRRAQYLAAQYPEWRMCVLTFNDELARSLRASLKGVRNIKRVTTFHSMCAGLLKGIVQWKTPSKPDGWIKNHIERFPVAQELGADFVSREITWIKETGISERSAYLACERKGRGSGLRTARRRQLYDVLTAYEAWLSEEKAFDWADVPHMVLQGMNEGQVKTGIYDAILIDEAQDFAPVWIEVVTRLLKPEGGLLFMADDPSQSIYRYYSWREKGVPVAGRTRWLRVPYRNTQEIYRAAYEVIRSDEVLKHQMEEQTGMTFQEPDLTSRYLRSGPRPELRRFPSTEAEFDFIRQGIERLLQEGFDSEEIAVLHRRTRGARRLGGHLRGLGVKVATFHALKGLEFETVFLSQMQETFADGTELSEQQVSEERRLVYMAMTRARQRLYLGYEGHWPAPIKGVVQHVDRALV